MRRLTLTLALTLALALIRVPAGLTDQPRDLISRILVTEPERRYTLKHILAHPWLKFAADADAADADAADDVAES